MIQVAIAAVEEVFDWKEYLRENFPETDLTGQDLETAAAAETAEAGA